MDFEYTRYGLKGSEKRLERILEIFPGSLSWLIIVGMAVLPFKYPLLAAVLIIAFLLYWLLRMTQINALLILSYIWFTVERNTDWMNRIAQVDNNDSAGGEGAVNARDVKLPVRISEYIFRRQIEKLRHSGKGAPRSEDIYHIVIIPVLKETEEIVKPGIAAIRNGTFPSKRILLIITVEGRATEEIKQQMKKIRDEFRENFWDFFVIEHPSDLPGEARVKGANTSFAGRHAAEFLREKKIPFENCIVSCFDADTVPVKDYFSCLTYHFLITPNRLRTSFQPVPVYFNNIWDAPAFARVLDVGTSFFQLIEATDEKKLITFSSHSMSFKALDDVGYWPKEIISDDSAIFWKALLYYDGDYLTVPMPITVSMDIATGKNIKTTFVNIYKQKRRWAWGVENFPIICRGFLHNKKIPLYTKIAQTLRLMDKFVSWATWPFLLGFSWIPTLFAGKEFPTTTVFYIAPRINSIIFFLSSFGLLICILTSWLLLPTEKIKRPSLRIIQHAAEWLLIPVVVLLLSALPALDAQTRLTLGKYLDFWVTDKYRKRE